jgi:hypothetical protein
MKLPMLPHDKANHLAYGAAIAAVTALLMPLPLALVVCVLAAVGKELIDLVGGKGTLDAWDAVANVAGSALVLAPLYLRAA